MDILINQNSLTIGDISIPLLATQTEELEIAVPYMLHGPFIYRLSQKDEAHLLRRILMNGLLPERRLSNRLRVNSLKHKINHPVHLRKFGQAFLEKHYCIMPDGTHKNCWAAYRNGDFDADSRKDRFVKRTLPKIGGYVFSCLISASCFYACAVLLGHHINCFALLTLLFLTIITAIPFVSRIVESIQKFKIFTLPVILMVSGAILGKIIPNDNYNIIIILWTSLGSIGTVLFLGVIGVFAIIMALMCLFDIFQYKHL